MPVVSAGESAAQRRGHLLRPGEQQVEGEHGCEKPGRSGVLYAESGL